MALKTPDEIRGAYSADATADAYIDGRFTSAWGSVQHAAQVRVVNDIIRRHGVERVLEIAPGPGRLSRDVRGFTHGVLCEFNDAMLRVARQRLAAEPLPWRLVRGDGFRLPVAPGRFDLVYSFRFIRHFELDERARLYEQVRTALNGGGLFVFDAVNVAVDLPSRGTEPSPIHDVFYTAGEIRAELAAHGFEPVALVDVIRHFTLQRWLQIVVAPRSYGLAHRLIAALEHVPGDPLEWVVVCRKA